MGRQPDPKKKALRREAARLERSGLNAPRIAKKMGQALSTVQYWLRQERGPQQPLFKTAVLNLLEQGETDLEQISAQVGCGLENVRKIEREWRGYLKHKRRSGEEMLRTYLAAPEASQGAPYTRYRSFGRALVDECNRVTNTDPKNSKWIIDLAAAQFSRIRSRLRTPEKLRHITCNLVQVKAIEAARERMLADSPAARESALRILSSARKSFEGCPSCDADLSRRESLVLRDLKRYDTATEALDRAENLYRTLAHDGHDGFRNGLGSCALARITIHYYSGQTRNAVRIADHALHHLVSRKETALHFRLRYNRGLALIEIPGKANEARSVADELMGEIGITPSIPRLHLVFMAGRAAEVDGDPMAALNHLEDAYEYAQELEIAAAIAALESDIARLSGSAKALQDRIARLRACNDDGKSGGFPSWLWPISNVLERASELAKTDFEGALIFLRQESGGNSFFPLSAAMANP